MFVREGISEPSPISSMPGVVQHSFESLVKAAVSAVEAGVGGLMIYGIPEHKDANGSGGDDPDGVLNVALRRLHAELGDDTVLMGDLCLDEFTDHGHCGVLNDAGEVDNDATLVRYAAMARTQADAGAHLLGTSGMMDGQVAAVQAALDKAGYLDTGILGYAPKYASSFYGPFREAVNSSLVGDRKSYQQDASRSVAEALAEVALDVAEGADIVMVKPALPYLDILRAVADASPVPVAAYQISGEYAMVEAAAERGWLERDRAIVETLTSIKRAGASMILTYWAAEVAQPCRFRDATGDARYREAGRSYLTTSILAAVILAGFLLDLGIGQGIHHIIGWAIALVLIVGSEALTVYAARVMRSITITDDEIVVGEETVVRSSGSSRVSGTVGGDADDRVLGRRYATGLPARDAGHLILSWPTASVSVLATRHPDRVLAVLGVEDRCRWLPRSGSADADDLPALLVEIDERAGSLFRVAGLRAARFERSAEHPAAKRGARARPAGRSGSSSSPKSTARRIWPSSPCCRATCAAGTAAR